MSGWKARSQACWATALLGFCSLMSCTSGGEEGPSPQLPPELPQPHPAELWLAETAHCTEGDDPLFDDVTIERGVTHIVELANGLPHYRGNVGGGIVLEDLDGDDDLDLYLTSQQGPNALLLNRGDGFFESPDHADELAFADDWTVGVGAADLDNDGLPELYVANDGPDRLLLNLGGARFMDVTESWGLDQPRRSSGVSFGDYDADGHLDVFVATLARSFIPGVDGHVDPDSSSLLRNEAGRGLSEVQVEPPLLGSTYAGGFVDLDDDGDVDLYTSQEFASLELPPRVLENQSGEYVDVTPAAGVHVPTAAMGVAALDVDGNGLLDLSVSNLKGARPSQEVLLEQTAPLKFVDVGFPRGAFAMTRDVEGGLPRTVSWAVLSWDVEHDGDEDLFFVYGRLIKGSDFFPVAPPQYLLPGQPDALLLNDGTGHFVARPGSCAEDFGEGRGAAVGDIDGDGCLDLVISNPRGAVRLLRRRCEGVGHSVQLRLVGSESNRDAIGARVRLETDDAVQLRHVLGGVGGVHSSSPKTLHFGIGDATQANRVTIDWPSGKQTVLQSVAAGSVHVVEEP